MSDPSKAVFLFDVDNTLLDNDRVEEDFKAHLERICGREGRERYWSIFEGLRAAGGFADYLGALQRYRLETLNDPRSLRLAEFLLEYPFEERLYSEALAVLRHMGQWGPTVILSDGDAVLQPRKVRRSGIAEAVRDRVLIYVHKEKMLSEVERLFPARHYVMVDDKTGILTAMKAVWGERLTSVFVQQGHYAHDPRLLAAAVPADVTLAQIGALLQCARRDLIPVGAR